MYLSSRWRVAVAAAVIFAEVVPVAAEEVFLTGFNGGSVPPTVDEAVAEIKNVLQLQNCVIERVVDHAQNARSVNLSLNDTKLVLFSDPVVDERLLLRDQTAALDLPQKLLVRQDSSGVVRVLSKSGLALYNRHRFRVADRSLRLMNRRTEQFAAVRGIITRQSTSDYASAMTRLQNAILAKPGFALAGTPLDYSSYVGRPTKLVIAGAPTVGTLLMQQRASIGLDLPLKILVWEDAEGRVLLSYNEPAYLARLYELEGPDVDPLFARMSAALEEFMTAACAPPN